jgi:hypothetical protein
MTHRLLAIAALLGVLAVACGKVGPPVRRHAESTATESSETTEKTGASAAEESEEEEQKP